MNKNDGPKGLCEPQARAKRQLRTENFSIVNSLCDILSLRQLMICPAHLFGFGVTPKLGRSLRLAVVLLLAWALPGIAGNERKEARFRVRCTKLTPNVPVRIRCRWGGEGLGGKVTSKELTRFTHQAPSIRDTKTGLQETDDPADELLDEMDGKPKDRVITQDRTFVYHWLNPGVWSERYPVSYLKRGFITFTLEGYKRGRRLKQAELEFEFSYGGKVLKRFTVQGPDGPTFGVFIPRMKRGKDGVPTEGFVNGLGGLHHYIQRKRERLKAQLGENHAVPKRYALITDCYGYRPGAGYACRTAHKATMLAEYEILRLIGINGIRGCPAFISQSVKEGKGLGKELNRALEMHIGGYPIQMISRGDGRAPFVRPGDGCPYHPDNVAQVPIRAKEAVQALMGRVRDYPVEEIWGLTVDEIGSAFDGAPEGKAHQGACPHCQEAFRRFIREDKRSLADFGAKDWQDIRSTYGYWGRSYWEIRREREKAFADAQKALKAEQQKKLEAGVADLNVGEDDDHDEDVIDQLDDELGKKRKADPAKDVVDAKKQLDQLIWNPRAGQPKNTGKKAPLSESGRKLLYYYSRRFNNESSARLFRPLQEALAAENKKKRQALARGEVSAIAKQPLVYSFALRGNTFLMGGHSLDFFDFYRSADNAFVYETSNRDPRVWQWDSYLCDVGRSLSRFMDKRFGVYVKPHRGAPMQRALSAVARGARFIFWYTYGPEWAKGDSFGSRDWAVVNVGKTARLLAAAEDVTYESSWAVPAELALVRPVTSEYFGNSACWENGKWIHTALTHAHIPVDALDEGLLLSEDISRYKAIYVSGSHLREDAAAKLVKWVETGGTLYTCGWGLARNEADQPLTVLLPVLGLKSRAGVKLWASVPRYGATRLGAIRKSKEAPAPETVEVKGTDPFQGVLSPAVGREILRPVKGAEVLANYADGGAAVVRHNYGQGQAYTVGFYAGLEYAYDIMHFKPYNAGKRSYIAAPALAAGIKPVVDTGLATVEGVLLKNRQTGRLAVILMNWTFKNRRLVPAKNLTVRIRGAGKAATARSAALRQKLTLTRDGDGATLRLPHLADGDILLLE